MRLFLFNEPTVSHMTSRLSQGGLIKRPVIMTSFLCSVVIITLGVLSGVGPLQQPLLISDNLSEGVSRGIHEKCAWGQTIFSQCMESFVRCVQ